MKLLLTAIAVLLLSACAEMRGPNPPLMGSPPAAYYNQPQRPAIVQPQTTSPPGLVTLTPEVEKKLRSRGCEPKTNTTMEDGIRTHWVCPPVVPPPVIDGTLSAPIESPAPAKESRRPVEVRPLASTLTVAPKIIDAHQKDQKRKPTKVAKGEGSNCSLHLSPGSKGSCVIIDSGGKAHAPLAAPKPPNKPSEPN